jgi:4-hydroxybutyrate dehydrogenase
MTPFRMYADISCYASFAEFISAEEPGERDFILTTEPVYRQFVAPLHLDVKTLFVESYGRGEPSSAMVDAIREEFPDGASRVFAIVGGSVMDLAKLASLESGSTTEEIMLGIARPGKRADVIAVPTTCGTGSEATNACSCELLSLGSKRGLNLDAMFPRRAALIPELIRGLPYKVFADSSVDALAHAVESFLSPKAGPHSELFSREAIRLILSGYAAIADDPRKRWAERAGDFLVAANFAGFAFCSAGCAAVHALSYPLGGTHHIPHGEANRLMLAPVLKLYKAKKPVGKLERLEEILGGILGAPAGQALTACLNLLERILPRRPLREYGIARSEYPGFCKGVIAGQQRLPGNSYVELLYDEMLSAYEEVH